MPRFSLVCLLVVACGAPEPAPAPPSPPEPAPPVAAPRRFGELMAEVGHRFERVGRAGQAGQWELAAYDLTELEEVFEGDVPSAVVPEDVPADVHALSQTFAESSLPPLAQAVASRDAAAFSLAFAATGAACNECHATADHGFILIPTEPGLSVPMILPAPAPTE